MSGDLSAQKENEYKRWQGYANALLIALSVIFVGTTISSPRHVLALPILSIIFGLAGIVLTALWFALENDSKIKGKPAFLWLASCSFVAQVGFLFLALLVYYATSIVND